MKDERILVVSAHALDFLWRCGGTIAKYSRAGCPVKVIDLTSGARGESNRLWEKNPDMEERRAAELREQEAAGAAERLGAEIQFFRWPDHMLEVTSQRVCALAGEMMDWQPTIVLTHFTSDPMNPDHPAAAELTISALRCAQTRGVFPGREPCRSPKLYLFEPAYPETVGYVPDVYLDITETMELKMEAMSAGGTQRVLAGAYDKRNGYRGHLAAKLSGNSGIQFAETFLRFKPYVGQWFC